MNDLRLKRLQEVLIAQLEEGLIEGYLDKIADLEYRLCLLELGVSEE